MRILQNKFIINLRKRKSLSSMILYMTANRRTVGTVTAAIMILMEIIVSVNTATTSSHRRPDMETTTTTAAVAAVAWTKAHNNKSINPQITQQPLTAKTKTDVKIQHTHMQSTSSSAETTATALSKVSSPKILSPFNMSDSTEQKRVTPAERRYAETSTVDTAAGLCKSHTASWGDINPNVFYICDIQTTAPLQLRCPEGNGFFLGLGYSGCIPYEQWPACILSGHHEQVSVCDSEHMQQPWEFKNPNKFYVCLKENTEPTILNCEPGKGFIHAIVTTTADSGGVGVVVAAGDSGSGSRNIDVASGTRATGEVVGCANWENWRNYMHCNDYY